MEELAIKKGHLIDTSQFASLPLSAEGNSF